MRMTESQLAQYRRDGYLIFPSLFSAAEIGVLRAETARLSAIEAETVIRERTGGVRSIFRVHEADGATRSAAFRALVRTPRVLGPTRQALGTEDVYIYHTKINTKPAIEGTVWVWHQDYGSWQRDGCARPDMGTFAVMMNDSTEMNGALYVVPGSHKRGRIEPYYDENTSYKFWAGAKRDMIEVLRSSPPPPTRASRPRRPLRRLFSSPSATRGGQPPQGGRPLPLLPLVPRLRQRAEVPHTVAPGRGRTPHHRAAANRKIPRMNSLPMA